VITPDVVSTTPHFSHMKPSGQGVVIHSTRSSVSMNPSEFEGALNWFKNPAAQVSSHWVIGRDGTKARIVADDLVAWHAGEHNATHWGIELEQGVESDGFTDAQMDALVAVCRGYVEDFGVPIQHFMHGFIGHQETPQGKRVGKSDPGALFDWNRLLNGLTAPMESSILEELKTVIDLGHFLTQGWNLADLVDWQRAIIADWNRRANG